MLCSLMQQPNQSSKGGFPLTGSVLAVSTVLYIRQRNSHFLHVINISTVHTYVCTYIFLIVTYVTQLSVVSWNMVHSRVLPRAFKRSGALLLP